MPFERETERLPGRFERRPADEPAQVAIGTLACPACDAPALPAPGGSSPADLMSCAFCLQAAPVRDFLSLAEPTRPTRVAVRVRRVATR